MQPWFHGVKTEASEQRKKTRKSSRQGDLVRAHSASDGFTMRVLLRIDSVLRGEIFTVVKPRFSF